MTKIIDFLSVYLNLSLQRTKVFSLVELTPDTDKVDGYKLCKRDFHNGAITNPVYSVSKSVSAMVLGLLFDKGLVKPEDKVCDYLGKYFKEDIDKRWYSVTIAHLLHHRTGLKAGLDFDFDKRMKTAPDDLLDMVLPLEFGYEPGEKYTYSDTNYYLICRIIEEISGEPAGAIAVRELFGPMHFAVCAWGADYCNHTLGGTGLCLSIEDFAKFGWLMAHKGVWAGKRILSEAWVDLMLDTGADNYGYGVRKVRETTYSISGARGQCVAFNLSNHRVIAWQSRRTTSLPAIFYLLDALFKKA